MFKFAAKILRKARAVHAQVPASVIEAQLREIYEQRAREINSRFSRGNVSLQRGEYIKADEIDAAFGGPPPWRDSSR